MSTYGDAKRRDMARSVLPSRRRKGAREEKRYVHHQVRTRIRNLIAQENWDDDSDLYGLDPQRNKRYQGIKQVVRDRRGADNLGPLMRWAEAKADEMGDTPQERYAAMRAMLPPNLIGWHAMTHIDTLDEYNVNPRLWRFGQFRDYKREREQKLEDLISRLDYNIDLLGALNRDLKKRGWRRVWVGGIIHRYPPRLWYGKHDTREFAEWVLSQPFVHERRALTGGENGGGWTSHNVGPRRVVAEFMGYDDTY